MAGLNPWDYAAKTRKEHAEQVALFMWANMAMRFGSYVASCPAAYNVAGWAMRESKAAFDSGNDCPIPELKWLHAVHNQGHGDAIRGAQAKAEGVKAGVSDIFLPVPVLPCRLDGVGEFYGLYIELKKKDGGKAHDEQLEFQADMREAGYKCEIIHGWELARDEILRYLGKL